MVMNTPPVSVLPNDTDIPSSLDNPQIGAVLPTWWEAVKDVMRPIPVNVWFAIEWQESTGNAGATNTTPPDDSYGLFQLNRNGGQGVGWSVDQLYDPVFNASIAKGSIQAAWITNTMGSGEPNDLIMGRIAADSGHPGRVSLSDSRIVAIVANYNAIKNASTDEEKWLALAHKPAANASSPHIPSPGTGSGGTGGSNSMFPDIGKALTDSFTTLGNKLKVTLEQHRVFLIVMVVGLLLILGAAFGLAR